MKIDTTYFERCITTLSKAHGLLLKAKPENIDYDMYRAASIKEFEIILELALKLLRKALIPYFHPPIEVDRLYYKYVLRQAVLHSIITAETSERWRQYHDNRNNTAHDYGQNFAEETLVLLPQFILDATDLAQIIKEQNNVAEN
jgi:nucleotidyltransferase substrate binding protein (TIGR01987 family)